MRIILIGPPGAGKGTQAEKLSQCWKIPRLTTGDLFRQAIQGKTPLGLKVQGILEKGSLVDDQTVLGLMVSRMSRQDCKKGFILDGFPRTVGQALGLEKYLDETGTPLDRVVALEISKEEALQRITGRRQCAKCGKAHHLRFQAPRRDGFCDDCGGNLVTRPDDEEAVVNHRLGVYEKETAPLIRFYQKKGLLKKIDGFQKPDQVFESICSLIK